MPEPLTPQRIQRKRTKGWKLPEGAIYVGRGTQWGNPLKIGQSRREQAVLSYRYEIVQKNGGVVGFNQFWVARHLRGKDLACWCPLVDKDGNRVPCHADILLEIANG